MSQKNKLTVGVLGLGYMGQNHARILSSLSSVNLVAVCDLDKAKSKEVGQKYKVHFYTQFSDLINNENLDAIFVCLPTTLHYEASKLALSKNIATFIEKPICDNIDEVQDLIKYSAKNGVPIMVGHIERFNPVIREIRKRINSGELGKILYVHTQRFSPPPTRIQDVSVILDLATHDVDIIHHLINEEPTRIFAETKNNSRKKEDLMSALLRFKSGIIGVVEVSWLHPTKIRTISVTGEKGMYLANYLTQELLFYKQSKTVIKGGAIPAPDQNWADIIKIAFESKEPLQIELEAFIEALQSKSKMPITAEEGLAALKLTKKFSESGQSHSVIK